MKSIHHDIHVKCVATVAMAFFFMNTMNVGAAEDVEEEKEEITFPYVINSDGYEDGTMPNGYYYALWKEDPGTVKMTLLGDEGKFNVEWNNTINFVARTGLKYDETQTHEEVGIFTADYQFQKIQPATGNLAYYGIYGWTVEPLVEFYVMESWDGWNPAIGNQGQNLGTINGDDGTYDVIKNIRNNEPSIKGKTTFPQIFSIRKQKSESGHISITEHFKKWESMGIELGKLYEIAIIAESWDEDGSNSAGSCNVTKAVIMVDGKIPTALSAPRVVTHEQYSFSNNDNAYGVYTLFSISGQTIKSMTFNPSKPAIFPTDNVAPGLYYLQFRGNGIAPVTKQMLVK